jgi:hypothetical protein
MMLQFRSRTSISLYYFVLVARSRQTGRSYNSLPGDDEVLMVVVLQIVLVIVPGVSAILRYCFFRSWATAAIIRLTEQSRMNDLLATCECEMYSGRFIKNVETSNTTIRLDLLTYCLTIKEVISRVSGNTHNLHC